MNLERTLFQLDIGPLAPERARELGRMGYLQWLAGLPGRADYRKEALRAFQASAPFRRGSPAVAVFCDLLVASTAMPPTALPLDLPARLRRGGAARRRAEI